MLGMYANRICNIRPVGGVNIYGERDTWPDYEVGAPETRLKIVFLPEGRLMLTPDGWESPFDAQAYIPYGFLSWEPKPFDRLLFSDTDETYDIIEIQPLEGLGNTMLGYRLDLKLAESAGSP